MESPQLKISDEGSATDDWAGLTDPAERRRRQNRINQRAHRRRQRMQANKDVHPKSVVSSSSSSASPDSASSALIQLNLERDLDVVGCMNPESRRLLLQFAHAAYSSYLLGSPTSDHLLMLTKVNVFRAFGHNMRLLGDDMSDMDDEALSIFNKALPSPPPPAGSPPTSVNSEMPISLQPTKLQRTVPHHPWIDFFPVPKMRDNLIQAGDWDDEKLCLDIMGFWSNSTSAEAGLLVWGEPWDVRNWEMTEAFLKKWQWVVRGCPELMNSTNSWRAKRGEKLIFRYI